MSNSLVYAEDGDNCKDGESVDEKEKMIFCANILLEFAKNGDVDEKVKTKDFCANILLEGARGQALTLFLRGINSLLNNLHICHDLADGLRLIMMMMRNNKILEIISASGKRIF